MGIGVSGFAAAAAAAFFVLPVTAAAPTINPALSVVLRLISFSLMMSSSAFCLPEKACRRTRVTGGTSLLDLQQQRVAVAIDERFNQPLRMPRGFALGPQFLPRARP